MVLSSFWSSIQKPNVAILLKFHDSARFINPQFSFDKDRLFFKAAIGNKNILQYSCGFRAPYITHKIIDDI